MKAYLLCGGLGTRLGDLTKTMPKPLLQVNGKPFIEILIDSLREGGVDDIDLVCGYLGSKFEYLKGKKNVGVHYENSPLGTGGFIMSIESSLPEKFFVLNGDTYGEYDFKSAFMNFDNALFSRFKRAKNRFDWINSTKNFLIQAVVDRKLQNEGFINSGVYLIEKASIIAFNKIRTTDVVSLEDHFLPFWCDNFEVSSIPVQSTFIDIGIPSDLKRASNLIGQPRKAIFLDRDGVLIRDTGHPFNFETFEYNSLFLDELSSIYKKYNVEFFVMTNQAGVARGLFTESDLISDLDSFCDFINEKYSLPITKYYYCPHHPEVGGSQYKINCDCRKPASGMLKTAMNEFNFEPSQCTFFGDRETDRLAAERVGVQFHSITFGRKSGFSF